MANPNMALVRQVSAGNPGALTLCIEILYDEQSPEALHRLLDQGVTGVDLCLLYAACEYSAAAVICRVFDGTALSLLRTNPESSFYVKPEEGQSQ